MTAESKVNILSTLCTRNEAGVHFTALHTASEIAALEAEGLIKVSRPVHESGTQYSEEYWGVEVTTEGVELVEAYPEYSKAS